MKHSLMSFVRTSLVLHVVVIATTQLIGCASETKRDLVHYPFPEAQEEIRQVLEGIFQDARNGDIASLRASHLDSDKFTKFGGKAFERLNIVQCNEEEAAAVRSASDIEWDFQDVKIDVFGDVAVLTNYLHVSFRKDGQPIRASLRGTLVFLHTDDGWKIVHEHVTPKSCFEQ